MKSKEEEKEQNFRKVIDEKEFEADIINIAN